MNFLDVLKTVYTKEKLDDSLNENWEALMLTKSLSKNKDNLPQIKKLINYLFFINPKNYFYLSYFFIKKKSFIPKSFKTNKTKTDQNIYSKKDEEFVNIILKYLDWTNKDLLANKNIFKKLVLENKKEWEIFLGI